MSPDIDYDTALKTLKQADTTLANLIEGIGQCTLDREQQTGDLLSVLSKAIISQQLSIKAAATIYRRFLDLYPEQLSPQAILETSDETLRGVGVSRSKIIYLKELARATLDELPTLEKLSTMDDESIIKSLTQVKGIGRWTAQMMLIFRLHRQDVLPVDDLGIRTAIRKAYNLSDLPDKKTVERLGEAWHPYCTVASWYLWRSLKVTA